jgi:hypothetical protein
MVATDSSDNLPAAEVEWYAVECTDAGGRPVASAWLAATRINAAEYGSAVLQPGTRITVTADITGIATYMRRRRPGVVIHLLITRVDVVAP